MDNTGSYSIAEAAEALNLSAKTIRRYIKAGKLPSVKVPTKFGDEYRITEIPESLRQEAEAQDRSQTKVEVVQPAEEPEFKLDAHQLYQDNIRLALQLGAANAKIRDLEEKLRLLQAPSPSFIASAVAEARSAPPPVESSASAPVSENATPMAAEHATVASASTFSQPQPNPPAAEPPKAAQNDAAETAEKKSAVPPRPWWKRLFGSR